MQKITPHLWFDKEAREAAELYVSLLPGSKVTNVTTLSGTPSGDCDLVSFELAGQPFMAISAGPLFKFDPSVSFHVKCSTTGEADALWERLSPGGRILMPLAAYPFSERYGWLEDMFVGNVCGKAEEAINFYVSVFKNAPDRAKGGGANAKILARYGKNSEPDKEGTVQYAQLSIAGQEFGAMDSAREHEFAFNEAISFIVPCDSQEEIDYLWEKLSAEPKAEQCGWLKDKYGLSWQIAPAGMQEFLSGDKARVERVTQTVLKMKKFDIAALRRAAG